MKIKNNTLPRSVVSIDIETTGLDNNLDAIIEIGAIRFRGNRIEDEWHSLINPNRRIPDHITTLTGIDNSMVHSAPLLRDVAEEFSQFVGDSPILGQNIQFDLGFLRKQKLCQFNESVDTYDLASVLLPKASRYNLASLGKYLAIPLPNSHRALDDARLTQAVFMRFFDQILELPIEIIREMVYQGETVDWAGTLAFKYALSLVETEVLTSAVAKAPRTFELTFPETSPFKNLELYTGLENIEKLDSEEVASYLDYGGNLSKLSTMFEHRPEQLEMLRAVSDSLSNNNKLLVEAGTGVGKSFAYLLPSALFAIKNSTRVVISTNTINLQDQLINKDIPAIREILGLDVQATILKGRGNYICPRRFSALRQNGPNNPDEMRVLGKVLVWSMQGTNGDRNDLTLNRPGERDAWSRISADDEQCSSETCAGKMGGTCPFYKAKQASQNAHIIIVNHALLLADLSSKGMVLPPYDHLIIDEGHHLESAATSAMSFRFTQFDLDRLLKEIGDTSGGNLGFMLSVTRNYVRPSDHVNLGNLTHKVAEQSFRLENYNRTFFQAMGEYMRLLQEGRANPVYSFQARITAGSRANPGWDTVEIAWSSCEEALDLIHKNLTEVYKALVELYTNGYDVVEDSIGSLLHNLNLLKDINTNVSGMIHAPTEETIYWVESMPSNQRLILNTAPLRIGPSLKKGIWDTKYSVILTSATLTTNGEFDYIKSTLNADDADVLTLGSPFDYENSALLYIPNDVPEPNAPGYENAVNRAIIDTAIATGGRMLVLFTNLAQLKRCGQAINHSLARQDISVFEQGDGASPATLLESFKSTEKAVLLGTRSFWEGVDVPGDLLSVVVITRLPFEVPSDPIVAARSETFDNPFNDYQVPEAILKFRQGFGRLIRSSSDRGIVAVLDRRVLTKNYGSLFINSLPKCTLRKDSVSRLPEAAKRWLNE